MLVASLATFAAGLLLFEVYRRRLVLETSGGAPISVLVTTRALTEGAVLERGVLGTRTLPEAYLEGRHIRGSDAERVVGERVAVSLEPGEAVLWTDLVAARPEVRTLATLVQPGQRALTVRASSTSRLLRPGDRVDVVLPAERGVDERTKAIVQNLVVLAIGTSLGGPGASGETNAGGDVTLAVTPEQAEALATLSGRGAVILALRNPDDEIVDARESRRLATQPVMQSVMKDARGEIEHVR